VLAGIIERRLTVVILHILYSPYKLNKFG
jgi:hypothetical protein